ncbi:TOMM precursor leader peptide-binding protein [Planomonospora corallina]|uniref:TOMM leader peptide-binding protein n=1 Tax=Planomonospora corallina TaxID=1806052 RepID=A0ABV8I3Y5_9ACTN
MAEPSLIPAEAMSHAVAFDPQFRMPLRPRLVPGLVTLPLPDGLLVEGTPTRQALRGTAARTLIPRLLPELDGRREAAELAADLDLPPAHLHQALSLLYTCGMLEDAAGPGMPEGTPKPSAVFLSRSIDSSRVNVSGGEAARRLAAARVALAVDDPRLADAVRRALLDGGIGTVIDTVTGTTAGTVTGTTAGAVIDTVTGTGLDTTARDGGAAGADLLILSGDHDAGPGVPILPLRLDGGVAWLGPYVDTSFTACARCVAVQRDTGEAHEVPERTEPDPELAADLTAALVAAEAVALLARVGSTHTLHGLVRVDLTGWHQRSYPLAGLPGCPRCGDGGTPEPEVPAALAYEESVAFPPRSLTNPRDHQVHYRPGNIALQVECKRWPSARYVPLPDTPEQDRSGPVPASTLVAGGRRLDVASLGALLRRAGGLRDDGTGESRKVQRWAPTGGNLGSAQLHVIARDVDGLDPAVYGYRVDTHRLADLIWADPYEPVEGVADAEAVIVVTGALNRVASKYSTFAWRVVHLDGGVALAQLRLVAAERGIATRVVPRWDDAALAALLSVDPDTEPITAVLAVNPRTEEAR